MAVFLYQSQLIDERFPSNETFTEEELIDMFSKYEYNMFKSIRLKDLDCWLLYTDSNSNVKEEMNSVASQLCDENVYNPVLFIHDNEIPKKWNILKNDDNSKNYESFTETVLNLIAAISQDLLDGVDTSAEDLPNLEVIGETTEEPKRIFFYFDPEHQTDAFYKSENLKTLCEKSYAYIIESDHIKDAKEPFIMYEDVRAIVSVPNEKISSFTKMLIDFFTNAEEYEKCINIKNATSKWAEKLEK